MAVRHPVSAVRLLAPLPRPNSLRDFLVFEEHLRNCGKVLGRTDELPPEWYNLPAHDMASSIGPAIATPDEF